MADPALALPSNVPGDWFVDTTCIDCDACRQIAPRTFHDAGESSAVFRQPESAEEFLEAQKALITCPTSSIGTRARADMRAALAAYPEEIAPDVYRCGFNAEASFGAFSYMVRTSAGNVLVDSPRFSGPLVRRIAGMGGLSLIALTHQDDVADHEKFAERFGAPRVLHRDDVHSRTSMIERQPSGTDPVEIAPELLMIPTPGHTRGHAVFLFRNRTLFTGDHLAWSERLGHLYAFRSACWYSWTEQIRSMERLAAYTFEWVLPGHGRPVHLDAAAMRESLVRCIEWMKR